MELRRMAPEEIEKYVAGLADEALERLPEGVKASQVNALALNQRSRPGGGGGGWEGWAEWTRACADQRSKIEDYSDPVIGPAESGGPEGSVLNSELRIQQLAPPEQG
jgi:hypothetical protein